MSVVRKKVYVLLYPGGVVVVHDTRETAMQVLAVQGMNVPIYEADYFPTVDVSKDMLHASKEDYD